MLSRVVHVRLMQSRAEQSRVVPSRNMQSSADTVEQSSFLQNKAVKSIAVVSRVVLREAIPGKNQFFYGHRQFGLDPPCILDTSEEL